MTMKLAFMAIIFELVVGIGAGHPRRPQEGQFIDNLVRSAPSLVISIPVFVIGFVTAVLLRASSSAALPDHRLRRARLVSTSSCPASCWPACRWPTSPDLTRTSLVENVRSDYVRTATAKGLPRRRIIGLHAMRNSLIPVITFIGADFGALLGGAIVTEGIFNINGIGGLPSARSGPARARRRRRGDAAGLGLPVRQPARRPPVRPARPEDPL